MNFFFGREPQPLNTSPTVSTEQPDQRLGFWHKNKKLLVLFGGCALLLVVARSCSSHQKEVLQVQKQQKVLKEGERQEADSEGQLAALKAQLFNAQKSVEAANTAATTPEQNPLTPAQMRQLAAAGVGGNTGAMNNQPMTGARPASYYNPEANTTHEPTKPVTLVISYRSAESEAKEPGAGQTTAPLGQFSGPTSAGLLSQIQPSQAAAAQPASANLLPTSASGNSSASSTGTPANPTFAAKTATNPEDAQHQLAASTGEKYRIREGTWLPCTEELRINGFFSGNINCLISIPIYSPSGAHLLIPQGTVALGHVAAVGAQNQQRLFVAFDEFIMPDGYTVNYENASGLDQIGQTGLRDKIDHHYLQTFGASVAIASLAGLAQIGNFGGTAITAGSQYRSGVTQGLSESAVHILDKFSNILPTFTIREGARNNIHLRFNLWLPDYTKHAMKADL